LTAGKFREMSVIERDEGLREAFRQVREATLKLVQMERATVKELLGKWPSQLGGKSVAGSHGSIAANAEEPVEPIL
jgi:hypothetical protein